MKYETTVNIYEGLTNLATGILMYLWNNFMEQRNYNMAQNLMNHISGLFTHTLNEAPAQVNSITAQPPEPVLHN